MRVRSIPSLVRALAIFIASVHAGGGSFDALAGARNLAQAPVQPVLQSDSARAGTALGAEETAPQGLFIATAALSEHGQDGTLVRLLEGDSAVAPARPPATRETRSPLPGHINSLTRADLSTYCALAARLCAWTPWFALKAPQRIRAP